MKIGDRWISLYNKSTGKPLSLFTKIGNFNGMKDVLNFPDYKATTKNTSSPKAQQGLANLSQKVAEYNKERQTIPIKDLEQMAIKGINTVESTVTSFGLDDILPGTDFPYCELLGLNAEMKMTHKK